MRADTATWYFDFISPFAYLQLPAMRALGARIAIEPVPIVFGAVLARRGQLGPAEIAGKREFTYRFVQWQADRSGIPLRFPPAHPFNPIPALRLCVAAGTSWSAVEAIFAHVWRDGQAATTPAELAPLARTLGIGDVERAIGADAVKAQLRTNTEAAIVAGVFGVPTLRIGAELFWGNDASAMIDDWLADPQRFAGPEYVRLATLPVGVERRR